MVSRFATEILTRWYKIREWIKQMKKNKKYVPWWVERERWESEWGERERERGEGEGLYVDKDGNARSNDGGKKIMKREKGFFVVISNVFYPLFRTCPYLLFSRLLRYFVSLVDHIRKNKVIQKLFSQYLISSLILL